MANSSSDAPPELRYLNMAAMIAQAKAFRLQSFWDHPMRLDEAIFQGMMWAAVCAEVAPEFLMAFKHEADVGVPVVRLPGTPPDLSPEDKVRQDIRTAAAMRDREETPEEQIERWHQFVDQSSG